MVAGDDEGDWKPGSFTKNFSWGRETGLAQLYDSIRIGFAGELKDVPRDTYRERVRRRRQPEYIPVNFFLFNRRGEPDTIVVDELVFQALTGAPGDRFDKLALFAFNFSYVGEFKGASPEQRRPALWAHHYVRDRVASELGWNVRKVDADDIESFVENNRRYRAQGARKLATNLNHLYKIGKLGGFKSDQVDRWWVDALFLALDRLIEDRRQSGKPIPDGQLGAALDASGFKELTGRPSLEKRLATKHLIRLYVECGGRDRFSEEAVLARMETKLADVKEYLAPNSPEPMGAVHLTNPRILKSIPAICAMLATYAGFEIIGALQMEDFDAAAFVKERTRQALEALQEEGVQATMTAEELLRLTRGR